MPRSKFATRLTLVVLSALTLAACSSEVPDTHPDQPVTKRKQAFKAMLRSFEPMGVMLRTHGYRADEFARLANELNSRRDAPFNSFAADTHYPPTKAKAAVWERTQEFESERQKFYELTDALAAAAQTHDEASVRTAYDKVHASCKSCHDDFKN